jgi:ADP-heptose:LPS heptosyltransferase
MCGKLSLMESASFVRQSTAVISNDTGLMHIAAAFNKPIVSVWGNTIPEFGMYPYLRPETPSMIAEVKGLKCRPCSKLGYKECPLKHFNCMRQQNIDVIASFVNNLDK